MGTWTSTASTPGDFANWICMMKDRDDDIADDSDSDEEETEKEMEEYNNDWLRSFQP